eukprot:1950787-Pleurochrysis_carterae.AAC.5
MPLWLLVPAPPLAVDVTNDRHAGRPIPRSAFTCPIVGFDFIMQFRKRASLKSANHWWLYVLERLPALLY